MTENLSSSALKVQETLNRLGFACQVVELPQTTRSAREAAAAIGCTVEQIAKSLIFKGRQSGSPVLAIASGGNRVNEKRLGELFGEKIERADADFVQKVTGFAIGGVPPVGHQQALPTFLDEDLLQYADIWAAAGNPFAVFKLTPAELVEMTGGRVADIKEAIRSGG